MNWCKNVWIFLPEKERVFFFLAASLIGRGSTSSYRLIGIFLLDRLAEEGGRRGMRWLRKVR